ncbi:MAG: family 16 glycoside hydrolase [Opitutales bacterium]
MACCCLSFAIHSAGATVDFLSAPGLSHFQPTSDWHRVERAVNVPDRTELTTKGKTTKSMSGGVLVNGLIKDISIPYLMTVETFADVRVELEFMIPQGSNAGVYLMGRYEVQILDSFGKEKVGSGDLGGIYGSRDLSRPKSEQWIPGSRPLANAAKAPGKWQKMEIVFRAPKFDEQGKKNSDAHFDSVTINGLLVQENVPVEYPTQSHPLPGEAATGPIVIQGDHGPIAIRKFTATPLESPGTTAIKEIDAYWKEVERSVREGDFKAYSATVHPEAVIISGGKQASYPLRQALIRWEKDFENTKSGKLKGDVRFRFAKRYRDTETALESGVFRYISTPNEGEATTDYVAFEALLVKKDGRWLMLMENQIAPVTVEEWEALSPNL